VQVRKWAVLQSPLQVDVRRVPPLLRAIIKLHNFCISWGEDDGFHEEEVRVQGDPTQVPVDEEGLATITQWLNDTSGSCTDTTCSGRRDELADYFAYGSNLVSHLKINVPAQT